MSDEATAAATAPVRVRGRFRPHARGFGFVTPVGDDGTTKVKASVPTDDGEQSSDRLFVPPALARTLVADDLVDAEVRAGDRGPAVEAATLVSRPRRLAVGTLRRRDGELLLEADRAVATGWLPLAESVADQLSRATQAEGAVAVVLIGAGASPRAAAVVAGPYPADSAEAVRAREVALVLGGAVPSLGAVTPAEVGLDPARAETVQLRVAGQLTGGRRGLAGELDRAGPVPGQGLPQIDRRDEPCVTVDGFSSRDLDDAVAASWDGDPDAPVYVGVHITDVAGAIGLGSPADEYARLMGATAYLTSGVSAPMLDPALSEGAASLVVAQDRPVLSARFAVLPDGTLRDVGIEPALVRSRARLSYHAVDRWLRGDGKQLRREASTQARVAETVVAAAVEAARRLDVDRDARLTLEELFDDAELAPAVVNGELTVGRAEPHAQGYRLIERLMVAANEAVGGWLAARGVPALYRVHEGIAAEHRERLRAAAALAGAELPAVDADEADHERLVAELLAAVDQLGAAGRDDARRLLISAATGAVARASYEPDPAAHRGLAAGAYCHFTSPLRRYADLVVHRQVRATLAEESPPYGAGELRALSDWLDARTGALSRLEARERADLWAVLLERGALRGPEEATVTGLSGAGLRVRLTRLGLTGFVPAEDALGLADGERGKLELDGHGLAAAGGQWRLGRRARVRYAGLDETGRPNWRLVDEPEA